MHWRTTVGGVLAALAQAMLGIGIIPGPWVWVAHAVQAVGLALLGVSAADKSQTGPPAAPSS
jgi:hypothetical protein